jgi:hypothetical protein
MAVQDDKSIEQSTAEVDEKAQVADSEWQAVGQEAPMTWKTWVSRNIPPTWEAVVCSFVLGGNSHLVVLFRALVLVSYSANPQQHTSRMLTRRKASSNHGCYAGQTCGASW